MSKLGSMGPQRTSISLKAYWNLLVSYLRRQWLWVTLLAVLLLLNIGLQLANPQIMRRFIDLTQAGEATAVLLHIALLFVGVALLQQVVAVLAAYVGERVGWTATNALRADLAEHCVQLDMSFHNEHSPGEMIERIDGDVTALASFFSQFVIQVLGNLLLIVGVLVLLFREDWRIGLALAVFSLAALLILGRLRDIAVPHWMAERQASADLFGFLEERLAGTEDIRANGARAYVLRGFYRLMRAQMKVSLKAALMINILLNAMLLLVAVGTAVSFAVGAYLFYAGAITIGTAYLAFHYTAMLERPINVITRQMQELQRAGAGIARIRELFQVPGRIQPPRLADSVALPDGPLAVTFEDVTFSYQNPPALDKVPDSPALNVLHDLSFHLRPGTVLGLLGRTGSGKTTLTRLIFRLYDPDSGAIYLGGSPPSRDLRQIPLPDLRQRVGMVTQDIQLFHAAVRDNLTFFDRAIPDERVLQVIGELGLGEWLRALPQGLDTVLESSGGGLSAGEAQLLAFARIFLCNPGLVILDEASSRLDPVTEALIERAVDRLVQGRTAIIIAHRLGTLQRADQIMILDGGRVREYGDRAALANDSSSYFYHLLQTGLEEVLA